MALVYILIALSLLSGIPPDTSAFKNGEFASFDASVLITWLGSPERHVISRDKKTYNFSG